MQNCVFMKEKDTNLMEASLKTGDCGGVCSPTRKHFFKLLLVILEENIEDIFPLYYMHSDTLSGS